MNLLLRAFGDWRIFVSKSKMPRRHTAESWKAGANFPLDYVFLLMLSLTINEHYQSRSCFSNRQSNFLGTLCRFAHSNSSSALGQDYSYTFPDVWPVHSCELLI